MGGREDFEKGTVRYDFSMSGINLSVVRALDFHSDYHLLDSTHFVDPIQIQSKSNPMPFSLFKFILCNHIYPPLQEQALLLPNVQLALDLIAQTRFLAGPGSTGVGFFGRRFSTGACRAEIVLHAGLVEETFIRTNEDTVSS